MSRVDVVGNLTDSVMDVRIEIGKILGSKDVISVESICEVIVG